MKFKTEAEAWDAIADTLEMIEAMPQFDYGGNCSGLCAVIRMMQQDTCINHSIYDAMKRRIEDKLWERRNRSSYLARKGNWLPRVAIARRFAEEARGEKKCVKLSKS